MEPPSWLKYCNSRHTEYPAISIHQHVLRLLHLSSCRLAPQLRNRPSCSLTGHASGLRVELDLALLLVL